MISTFGDGVEWSYIVLDRFCALVSKFTSEDTSPFIESVYSTSQMIDVEDNTICVPAINKRMALGEKHGYPGWGEVLSKDGEVFVPYEIRGHWMAGHLYKSDIAGFVVRIYNSFRGSVLVNTLNDSE